ncbi:DUF4123 domain-containing protein [Halomonas sp. V046]|uniref:DUF4123 domain-containing protein n=1 Tax=Halomonas sp. V046 TaxID=3459611 RepID=UPI004044DF8D
MSENPVLADEPMASWLKTYRYALLNPLTVEADAWADLPSEPLANPLAKVRPHLQPHLVLLEDIDAGERAALSERIERYRRRGVAYFCALLDSPAPAGHVVEHLKQHLVQRRPGDQRRWWLRYYDPHVFRHLCWQWDDGQMDRLLGPINAWCWPNDRGQWHRRGHQSSEPQQFHHLLLSGRQWSQIDRLALLNSTLVTLMMSAPEREQNQVLWQWTDALLEQARQASVKDDDGCKLYVEQAVCFHPNIHAHPALRSRLDQVRQQGHSYIEVCADLDEATMERLAGELDDRTDSKEAP